MLIKGAKIQKQSKYFNRTNLKNRQLKEVDIITKFALNTKKERQLRQKNYFKLHKSTKTKNKHFVIEGLEDLGIFSRGSNSKSVNPHANIPIRILSRHRKLSLDNSFNEKAIKSLINKKKTKSKNRKLAPDMDTFASPLIMFQRVPAVPNRMGHSILMNLNKMFGGKLNIKIPPQPPVIMVNQTPFYSTI